VRGDAMMVAVVYAKGRCFQHIVSMMPPHAVYIEAFLGGGAVLRNKLPAEWSIGIDLDPAVASLWERESVEGVEIVNGDAIDFLLTYQFEGDELVYCDPPYLQETRRKKRIYRYEYDRLQHELLLDTLLKTPCRVMLSGYRSRLPEAAEATLLPKCYLLSRGSRPSIRYGRLSRACCPPSRPCNSTCRPVRPAKRPA
jgi:site-specific DNA-adenine methylase